MTKLNKKIKIKINLVSKNRVIIEDCAFNAGERFAGYEREYKITLWDGEKQEHFFTVKKANSFSSYGTSILPDWAVYRNGTPCEEDSILYFMDLRKNKWHTIDSSHLL